MLQDDDADGKFFARDNFGCAEYVCRYDHFADRCDTRRGMEFGLDGDSYGGVFDRGCVGLGGWGIGYHLWNRVELCDNGERDCESIAYDDPWACKPLRGRNDAAIGWNARRDVEP